MENNNFPNLGQGMTKLKKFRLRGRLVGLLINVAVAGLVGAAAGYYSYNLAGGGIVGLGGGGTVIRKNITENKQFAEDNLVIDVARKSSPAVVSIIASKDLQILSQHQASPFQDFCNDPFFRQFFNNSECQPAPAETPAPTQHQQVSAGSGFIVRSDGLIVTNKHVVDIAGADFTVITSTGKKYPAKVLAKDPFHDFAMVKITSTESFPTLPLGDSSKLQIGQSVVAIGNALGEFSNTVSRGVVSGLSRSIVAGTGSGSEKLDQLIQTDAAINPGNSGGPLLNLQGEVVGIDTAIAEGAQNVGFALSINQVKTAIGQISNQGRIIYPYLGVRYQMITPALKQSKNLPVSQGAWINGDTKNPSIAAGSPAEKAGLKDGDIILAVNDRDLTAERDLATVVQALQVGQQIRLKVLRGGQTINLALTLEERKP